MRSLAMRSYLWLAFLFFLIGVPVNAFARQKCPDIPGAAYKKDLSNQKLSGYIVSLQPGTQVSKINLKSTLSNLLSRKFQEKNDERFNCRYSEAAVRWWMCTVSSTGERYRPKDDIDAFDAFVDPTSDIAEIPDRNGMLVRIRQSQSNSPGAQYGEGGITDNDISVGFASCINKKGGYYTLVRISTSTPTGWVFLPYLILYKHTMTLNVETSKPLPSL